MHTGALLQQSLQTDLDAFGIVTSEEGKASMMVQWEVLRENVQNYIRGLNFKYRVAFREKEVTYLNKLEPSWTNIPLKLPTRRVVHPTLQPHAFSFAPVVVPVPWTATVVNWRSVPMTFLHWNEIQAKLSVSEHRTFPWNAPVSWQALAMT
jgi:hypothetical protein